MRKSTALIAVPGVASTGGGAFLSEGVTGLMTPGKFARAGEFARYEKPKRLGICRCDREYPSCIVKVSAEIIFSGISTSYMGE